MLERANRARNAQMRELLLHGLEHMWQQCQNSTNQVVSQALGLEMVWSGLPRVSWGNLDMDPTSSYLTYAARDSRLT